MSVKELSDVCTFFITLYLYQRMCIIITYLLLIRNIKINIFIFVKVGILQFNIMNKQNENTGLVVFTFTFFFCFGILFGI